MKEGTVPVPLAAPALSMMMKYCLFRNYRIMGGEQSCWDETPVMRSCF